ncbi:hypothetical protein DFH05DRAFT_65470 [Lentinula detonsa]|uniref:Protein kinase domain-containing protein n=1 Tax=Lentinula detonsa TaxID=2804962 RepID=A0A9W8U2Q7_9AGAR|nr:hypothetical protein DFH05DRAFT_65470 [Lentinula detonsa]KAJ3985660.1 hypothetical protein F5890DRAFT_1508718 [Lentinula detonsa]
MPSLRYIVFVLASSLLLIAHAAPLVVPRGLLGTTWIEASISSDVFLNDPKDKELFSTTLTGVKLGQRLTPRGKYNAGLYLLSGTYKGHPGSSLVLKIMKSTDNAALGEAKALREIGDLVASGMLSDKLVSRQPVPVIIMLKKPGDVLSTTKAYKEANVAIKEQMRTQTNKLKCEKVASLAVTKHILHLDNHEGNGLVTLSGTTVASLELIDFGVPDTFLVGKSVKEVDVLNFCLQRLKSKAQSA